MNAQKIFEGLRTELHNPPSRDGFWNIMTLVEKGAEVDPDTFESVWLPYAREHLQRWREQSPIRLSRESSWSATLDIEILDPLIHTGVRGDPPRPLETVISSYGLARTLLVRTSTLNWTGAVTLEQADELAQSPLLLDHEGLSIHDFSPGPEITAALLASPNLANIKALSITSSAIRMPGTHAIAANKAFKNLELLLMNRSHVGGAIEPIAKSKHLRALRALILDENALYSHDIKALAKSRVSRTLEVLSLNSNKRLGRHAAEALAGSKNLGALRTLNMRGTDLRADGFKALATSPLMHTLEHLCVRSNKIGAQGLAAIDTARTDLPLTQLDLAGNPIGVRSAALLAKAPLIGQLTHLDLSSCKLGDKGFAALAKTRMQTRLNTLRLYDNALGPGAATALAQSPLLIGLEHLDIGYNPLGDEGIARLLQSPHIGSLRSLSISSIDVGPKIAATLADCASLANLTSLDISSNWELEDKGMATLQASPHIGHLFK